jgi:ketosteroid isomerase-like protein
VCCDWGDTHRVMSEESATPDLVELTRGFFDAASRRDMDAAMSFCTLDVVSEFMGMGTRFDGVAASRGFLADWIGAYEEYEAEAQEILDLGNGVTSCVVVQKGRPVGSSGFVQLRSAGACVWTDGLLARIAMYTDTDEGRAAAEQLAEERADA